VNGASVVSAAVIAAFAVAASVVAASATVGAGATEPAAGAAVDDRAVGAVLTTCSVDRSCCSELAPEFALGVCVLNTGPPQLVGEEAEYQRAGSDQDPTEAGCGPAPAPTSWTAGS
jgi:hypothetical protein